MKPVRWGMIGVGKHLTMRVLPTLRNSAVVEICGIASRSPEKAGVISQQYGAQAYSSYQDVLADSSIEAVFISLPNHIHLEWIKKSADAGKHILCEKPLTMNEQETNEAFEYAREKGIFLMEAFMYRFHPLWAKTRELVLSGAIGPLQSVHTFFFYNNTDPKNIRNRLELGGGALYDIGCYAISVARYLFDAKPLRVLGLFNRDESFGTDILTSGIMDFGKGQASFTVGTQTAPHQKVEILGSDGKIVISPPFNIPNDIPAKIILETSDGIQEINCDTVDQYRIQFESFSAYLRQGGELPLSPDDTINNIKVIDALFASEKSGVWETIV